MDVLSPSIRQLARRLTESQAAENAPGRGTSLVNARLRSSLTEIAGVYGFASLLRRALALASAEVPELASVKLTVSDDGHLQGLEQLATRTENVSDEAAAAVTAHLIGLLVLVIGVALTARLVRHSWPECSLDDKELK